MTRYLLAHQGGWDEALLVVAPVLVFAGIVWQARRRAIRGAADDGSGEDTPDDNLNSSDSRQIEE